MQAADNILMKIGASVPCPPPGHKAIFLDTDGEPKQIDSAGAKSALAAAGYTIYDVAADVQDYDIPTVGAGDWQFVFFLTGTSGTSYTVQPNAVSANLSSVSTANNGAAITPQDNATTLVLTDVSTFLTADGRFQMSNFTGKAHVYSAKAFRKTAGGVNRAWWHTEGEWNDTADMTSCRVHGSAAASIKVGSWFAAKKE